MTEQEWLQYREPDRMASLVCPRGTDRKLRLLACACCREFWHLLKDKRSQDALIIAEQYADGLATKSALNQAHKAAGWFRESTSDEPVTDPGHFAAIAVYWAAHEWMHRPVVQGVLSFVAQAEKWAGKRTRRRGEQGPSRSASLLGDIFGNPFRKVVLDTAWRTPAAVALAQGMYDDRRFDDMPLLADALEEAGCTEEAILKHCREPGEHVRGCWVVDLILDKT
jgi:hypothetical protein